MSPAEARRPVIRAGFCLGIAFGGFFDGILLHQVLQWHHLLSGVSGGWFGDLRHQVMADGLFHALMYLIGAAGLVMLLRHRSAWSAPGTGDLMVRAWLAGFGTWHLADAVLSHWVFGLHRVRMDTSVPLLWDLGWAALFGVLPLVVAKGWRTGVTRTVASAWAPFIVATTLLAGWVATGPTSGTSLVVLAPGVGGERLFEALAASDARVVGSNAGGDVWLVVLASPADAVRLYRHGAMYVSGTLSPAGCSAWFRQGA